MTMPAVNRGRCSVKVRDSPTPRRIKTLKSADHMIVLAVYQIMNQEHIQSNLVVGTTVTTQHQQYAIESHQTTAMPATKQGSTVTTT